MKVKIIKAQVMMKFQMRSKFEILLKQFNNINKTNIPQLFTYLHYSIQNIDDQTERIMMEMMTMMMMIVLMVITQLCNHQLIFNWTVLYMIYQTKVTTKNFKINKV